MGMAIVFRGRRLRILARTSPKIFANVPNPTPRGQTDTLFRLIGDNSLKLQSFAEGGLYCGSVMELGEGERFFTVVQSFVRYEAIAILKVNPDRHLFSFFCI